MTDRPLITPQDISLLARPCYADEAKVLAYIYEAEQNNIKTKIGDDLFLRLKDGENPLLLEGGIYEKNGKRYQLNGIKKALAYYAYSRLLESGSVDLTRQGVVNRRSDNANAVDEDNIIKISRETYAIADRYMQEIMDYLGAGEAKTTQRTSVRLIGASEGASRSRQQQTSLGAIDPNKYATKDYVDGKIAALDFPEVGDFETKEDAEKKLEEAKRYTDESVGNIEIPELPTLAKVAESGDYNDLENKPTIPSLDGYATERYVQQEIVTKQDKTAIVPATNTVSVDKRSVIDVTGDVVINLEPYEQDGYAHSYEIVLNVGGTAYSVSFPSDIRWVKDLEIAANKQFNIIIEDGIAMWAAVDNQ
jgi:hypothetical protein